MRPYLYTAMRDPVREFLQWQQYAGFGVSAGLAGLVAGWRRVVDPVARGDEQYEDDYLNDVDGRRILAEALHVAPADERRGWEPRVRRGGRAAAAASRAHRGVAVG